MRTNRHVGLTLAMAGALFLSACGGGSDDSSAGGGDFGDLGGCEPVVAAISPEKKEMFNKLSELFAETDEAKALTVNGNCARIAPQDVSSGEAARLLAISEDPWSSTETVKSQPVIWSPASSQWVERVNSLRGSTQMVPEAKSFAVSPVVFAMPERMAKAMGWPDKPIGLSDMHDLCMHPEGWGKYGSGASTWGNFKLGKTAPETSTTGLNALLMQAYAATDKASGLTADDIKKAEKFSKELESCVIHYGSTTGNVLQRNYDRDQNGQSLGYVSAVAVEETSVVNYNRGNPSSSVVEPGTQLTPPKEKMVAIYPEEGSLVSDNPIGVLGPDATWVTEEQRAVARAFVNFTQTAAAQGILNDYGFRSIDPKAKAGGLLTAEYGVQSAMPKLLETPSASVTSAAIEQWKQIRKSSSVMMLVDISGSMGERATDDRTRMEVAKEAASATFDHFRPTDEVGLWAFTTGLGPNGDQNSQELRKLSPIRGDAEQLRQDINALEPTDGTPLYDTIAKAHQQMSETAEPGRINAIVVLSDGRDEGSMMGLEALIQQLRDDSEGANDAPVRVFPILFSPDAPAPELRQIAEASGGQVFDATDPRRLSIVMNDVMNNF